jgi:hypothetical protein
LKKRAEDLNTPEGRWLDWFFQRKIHNYRPAEFKKRAQIALLKKKIAALEKSLL